MEVEAHEGVTREAISCANWDGWKEVIGSSSFGVEWLILLWEEGEAGGRLCWTKCEFPAY